MRNGATDELIIGVVEIGERLLQWANDQELPHHTCKQHYGIARAKDWEATSQAYESDRRQEPTPLRRMERREDSGDRPTKRGDHTRHKSRERERRRYGISKGSICRTYSYGVCEWLGSEIQTNNPEGADN
jgi:hypothetical protein